MTKVPKPSDLTAVYACKYDAWNRLTFIWVDSDADGTADAGETVIARYEYDGLNRRVKKHLNADTDDDFDAFQHFFYNSGWQLLETRKSTSENNGPETLYPEYQYVWSVRYIDAPVLRDENKDSDDDCTESGTDERLYYLNDANMNVTCLVDTGGNVAERYVYDPYGAVKVYSDNWSTEVTTWAASKKNNIRYCGYFFDDESGLYNPRNRYYHPRLGCWCQTEEDYYDGLNMHEYALSTPLDSTDPFGRWVSGPPFENLMPGHTTLMTNGLNSVPQLAARLYDLYRKAAIDGNLSMDKGYSNLKYAAQGFTDKEAAKHFMVGQGAAKGSNHPSARVRQAAAQASVNMINENLRDCTERWRSARQQVAPREREKFCKLGWTSLGEALHTFQDAFAHSDDQGQPLTSNEHGGTLVGEGRITTEKFAYQLFVKWQRRDNPALNRARFLAAQQATNALIGAVWRAADGPAGCNCIEKSTGWGPI